MKREYEFSGGSISLDFIDTVADRYGSQIELINNAQELSAWFADAKVYANMRPDTVDLTEATSLRDAAFRTLSAAIDGNPLPQADIDILNGFAAQPDFRPEYRDGEVQQFSDNPYMAALSNIAADAINLLHPDNLSRLRRCRDCRMLFRDNSRPGKRIWCSSSSGCGNRAKVRRHRAKVLKE